MKHFPQWPQSPIEAIFLAMHQHKLNRRDLEPYIGTRGRVSEVLNAKRPLTLPMIRALHKHLGIPAEILIQDYPLIQTEDVSS